MLNNEKYTGDIRLLKSGKGEVQYLASDNNSVIISKKLRLYRLRRGEEVM